MVHRLDRALVLLSGLTVKSRAVVGEDVRGTMAFREGLRREVEGRGTARPDVDVARTGAVGDEAVKLGTTRTGRRRP